MLGSTFAHDWVELPAASNLKFWSYIIQDGHLYFWLAFEMMAMYANRSGSLSGLRRAVTAMTNPKHWTQVAKSGS